VYNKSKLHLIGENKFVVFVFTMHTPKGVKPIMRRITRHTDPVLRRMRLTPLEFCLRVIVYEKPLNLVKTKSIATSVLLLFYNDGLIKRL